MDNTHAKRPATSNQPTSTHIAELEQQRKAIVDAVLPMGDDPPLEALTAAFLQGMAVLDEEIAAIAARIEELTALGCVQASPHYRKDAAGNPRYLYLIHPTQADGSRKREYVGTDEEKKAEALAAVDRYDERERLKVEFENRRSAYRVAITTMRQALHYVEHH